MRSRPAYFNGRVAVFLLAWFVQVDGKQFIVLAVSGSDGAELLAYALP